MANFTTNAPDDLMTYIAKNGSATINYRPTGYWTDMITIYVSRMFDDDVSIKISQGSGGRDTDQVESDAQAALYFAEALTDAANFAARLERADFHLAKAFNAYEEARRQEFLAEIEAEKAAREADVPMINAEATETVNNLIEEAKKTGKVGFSYMQRGTHRNIPYMTRRTPSGRVTIRYGAYGAGHAISKKEFIAKLTEDACSIQ